MKHNSNLKAIDIMNILFDYDNIVTMDLTLDELRDVTEFIRVLNSDNHTIMDLCKTFERSANNYEKLCDWHEREPQEISEEDCEDEFNAVKWHAQELAEEACQYSWLFLAQ